jgi:hypothetical protein
VVDSENPEDYYFVTYIEDPSCAFDDDFNWSCTSDGVEYPGAESEDCIVLDDESLICHPWGEYYMPDPEDDPICYVDAEDAELSVCEPV